MVSIGRQLGVLYRMEKGLGIEGTAHKVIKSFKKNEGVSTVARPEIAFPASPTPVLMTLGEEVTLPNPSK